MAHQQLPKKKTIAILTGGGDCPGYPPSFFSSSFTIIYNIYKICEMFEGRKRERGGRRRGANELVDFLPPFHERTIPPPSSHSFSFSSFDNFIYYNIM